MRRPTLLALAAVVASAGCSARQLRGVRDWRAGGALAMDASYRRRADGPASVDGIATVAIRLRGGLGPRRLGAGVGIDLAAGGSHPGGLAWRAAISPVGIGFRLGRHGVAGVIAGVGGSGVTGRIDAGFELPVEAYATMRVGGRAAVSLWIQPAWLPATESRQGGAPDVGFVDELRAGLTLRVGRNYHRWGFRSGNGYHLGVVAAEGHGARWLGVTLGYDLDVATE